MHSHHSQLLRCTDVQQVVLPEVYNTLHLHRSALSVSLVS